MSAQKLNKADVVTDFRRSQVLAAARERFSKHGLAGTTMDGIAKAAGVAKGTVYLYYKSKEDILRQILDEDLRNLHDDTVPLISGPGTIEEKLQRLLPRRPRLLRSQEGLLRARHFEMGTEVRKKALQKLEVVFRAQVEAWETTLADAQRAGDRSATRRARQRVHDRRPRQRPGQAAAARVGERPGRRSSPSRRARTLWKGLAAR